MPAATTIALTGLRAFEKKLDVTANNVANVETNGFKKSRVDMQEIDPGGVKVSISRVNTPGVLLPSELNDNTSTQATTVESSNVDLHRELVNAATTPYYYEANLKVIQVEGEMIKELIDIKA